MDNIFNKFGIYDLFSMLVPGVVITVEFLVLMPKLFENILQEYKSGIIGYFLFFVTSYVVGIFVHELGTIWDEKRGLRRNTFLINYGKKETITGCLDFEMAKSLKSKVLRKSGLNNFRYTKSLDKNYEETKFLYSYCVNYSEIEGINGKSEKMQSTAEMCRSIYWGSVICAIGYIIYGIAYEIKIDFFYFLNEISLIVISVVFFHRNIRYQKYRIRSLIRTCFIKMMEKEDECIH